jgi:uncharacterized protein (TIGR00299 family) protein
MRRAADRRGTLVTATPRVLWCNPSVGVAGDMLLAALLDLGADEGFVRSQLELLPVTGWRLDVGASTRRGLVATSVQVDCAAHDHHRPWSHIDEMLATSGLHPAVADGARRTFSALGHAEASVHGTTVDEVHFHEVGAVDAIVDIVGSWAALTALQGEREGALTVASAPIGLGSGTAAMAHGELPVPAPAVLELLQDRPVVPVDVPAETATPTGVALLVTMVDRWGHVPAGTIRRVGRGAGRRDPSSHANVVTVVELDLAADDGAAAPPVEAVVIETNVDDVTPETIAYVLERALELGADDAWVTPIVMKKGRPAQLVSVLCRGELAPTLRELLVVETATLGTRTRTVDKHEMARSIVEVEVEGQVVRVKVGPHGAKAEHDDLAAVARSSGRSLRDVAAAAEAAWRDGHGRHPGN